MAGVVKLNLITMKTVFSNAEVPHIWANQQQHEGRNSGDTFYFSDDVIYSYGGHFPIAAFAKDDSNTVFFTTEGYSNTTARHISQTRSACSHKNIIYCSNPEHARKGLHLSNLGHFENVARNIAMRLANARKPEIYLNSIANVRAQFEEYVKYCKVSKKQYKGFKYIFIESQEGGTKATEKERKAIERQRKEAIKRRKEHRETQVREFLTFERTRIEKWSSDELDMLRFNEEKNRIETSQGVEIPLIAAERFYNWIKLTLNNGGCQGECNQTILNYRVTLVSDEIVKIGCHTIETKHMLEIGATLFE